jgi:Kunitz/Bovine pancreatic trypsin inhibitor domain
MLPEVGPCRGTIPRWSFDPTSQTCKRFLYGGCQGNGNNFADSSECLKVCGGGATGHVAPANVSITVPERLKSANTSVALNELCLTGTAMIPVLLATGLSNNSIEACSETTGCPLSHSCVRSNGQVACCPKTADDCFLPLISGQCKASVQRFHFNPKTKTCDPFVYSGCNANGNNFATDSQCRSLCPGKFSIFNNIFF